MTLLRLKAPDYPGITYRYADPDDGYEYNAKYGSYQELIHHIVNRRRIAKLEQIEDMDFVVQAYLAQMPENKEATFEGLEGVPLSKQQYFQGAKVLFEVAKRKMQGKSNKTPEDIARLIALRCMSCIKNSRATRNLKWQDKIINLFIKGRSNVFSQYLGKCLLCGCGLASKVSLPASVIKTTLNDNLLRRLPKDSKDHIDGETLMTCWMIDPDLMEDTDA